MTRSLLVPKRAVSRSRQMRAEASSRLRRHVSSRFSYTSHVSGVSVREEVEERNGGACCERVRMVEGVVCVEEGGWLVKRLRRRMGVVI